MKKVVEGNLIKMALDGEFQVIVHGCNCFHTMGAGIAKQIKLNFPEAYEADLTTKVGDKSKLGDFARALIRKDHLFFVVNAYTQYHYGRDGRYADYGAINSVFRSIAVAFPGMTIGYPMIGAGLAGGDWKLIEPIIDKHLINHDHTLVILDSKGLW